MITISRIICLIASAVSCLHAYGMFVSSGQNTLVYSGNGVGLVSFDQDVEELDLFVYVLNNYVDTAFAWIIPLPAMPEVSVPELPVFNGLARISSPVYKAQPDYGCGYSHAEPDSLYGKEFYEVLKYNMIYPQTSDTMYVETIDTLISWLAAYNIALSSQSQDLITSYVNKGWKYFYVAVFDDPQHYEGKVGVSLKFASAREVIPIEIARGNNFAYYDWGYYTTYGDDMSAITLYAYSIMDHKRACPLGDLAYANSIDQDEAANIADDFPALGTRLGDGDFVTKLKVDYVRPDENIVDDIVLTAAADDDEYRELYEEYDYYYYGAMSPLFILMLLGIFYCKNKLKKDQSQSGNKKSGTAPKYVK